MKRKIHNPELIVKKLREADEIIASGGTIEQACKQLGISDAPLSRQTDYAATYGHHPILSPMFAAIVEISS